MAPAVSEADLATLIAGNTAFAADLYRTLASTQPGNLVVSPHSIWSTTAMAYAGARGTTESEMAAALHFDLPQATLHQAMNYVDLALASREHTDEALVGDAEPPKVRVANSLWGRSVDAFDDAYLDTLATSYGAGMYVVDFGDAETVDLMNRWVADRTEDLIQDVVTEDAINALTTMALLDALYFRAQWQEPFDPSATIDGAFMTRDAGSVAVPMMRAGPNLGAGTPHGRWGAGDRFHAAELPYVGQNVSMIIVVPDLLDGETGDPLALLEAELDGPKLAEIVGSLNPAMLTLTVPTFRFALDVDLIETMQRLGMVSAFGPADFSGMGTVAGPITALDHRAVISVDERGTEAAAATVLARAVSGAPPGELIADRPFMFLIRDATGAILFIGRVVDPRSG